IPVRYSLYVALLAALLLGVVLDALHDALGPAPVGRHSRRAAARSGRPRRTWALPGALAVVALLPLTPKLPFTAVQPLGVPAYFASAVFRLPAGSTAVLYPFPTSTISNGQMWQAVADLHFRMPGGYFLVPQPPEDGIAFSALLGYSRSTLTAVTLTQLYDGDPPPLTPVLRARVRAQWSAWHVRTVIAFPEGSPRPDQAIGYFTTLVGAPPSPGPGGAFVWRTAASG
ncbi:MAG TPA: hypothetical protein VEJ44_07550, partial [Acidimicrobiales bacterium]|nr:hypothetical protein [Acidimicrobiales bacterium]